jgi:hypothetical protein
MLRHLESWERVKLFPAEHPAKRGKNAEENYSCNKKPIHAAGEKFAR